MKIQSELERKRRKKTTAICGLGNWGTTNHLMTAKINEVMQMFYGMDMADRSALIPTASAATSRSTPRHSSAEPMIETKEVIEFFDRLAPGWDAEMIRNDAIINTILDNAGVQTGKHILDVACGTGVLIPDYLKRNVASVTGIDISPKMIEIAKEKFHRTGAAFLCGDVETADFGKQFDCIVVYNAFPHFPDPERLIAKLASLLKPDGTLTVAHGMSREKIDAHHNGAASHISNGLMSADDLASLFEKHLSVSTVLSDDRMYQVVGIKK